MPQSYHSRALPTPVVTSVRCVDGGTSAAREDVGSSSDAVSIVAVFAFRS